MSKAKVNLIDPVMCARISKTLRISKPDYWGPTKNVFQSFYEGFIKPNFFAIVFLIMILLFLFYRYRLPAEVFNSDSAGNIDNVNDNDVYNPNNTLNQYNYNTQPITSPKNTTYDVNKDDMLSRLYENYKDNVTEMGFHQRYNAKGLRNKTVPAYPIFPTHGGTLLDPQKS